MQRDRVPRSLSVYRGQTRRGIGEGPGSAVPQGEQYMDAAKELQDVRLLREIRPWMTLDSDPAHHGKLHHRLEAWSVVPAGGRLFVARLSAAGVYLQRAAYFTHARAWPDEACRNGFDPGLLLGNAAAFDPSWRDLDPGTHTPRDVPDGAADVRASDSPDVVARFLAFLLQGMAEQRPVIVAVPLEQFAEGSPLPARLGLARAALPTAFKRRCRLRIYTQNPEHFLGTLRADLLAVPADLRGAATAVRRDAVVLDENGRCENATPDPRAVDYARIVLQEAQRNPEGLLPFAERFGSRHHPYDDRLPDGELRYLQVVYYLAYGLAGPEKRRGALLNDFLFKTSQQSDLPWPELIAREDWTRIPVSDLARFLLRTDGERPERRRALQEAAEQALGQDTDPAFLRLLREELAAQLTDGPTDSPQKQRVDELLEAGLLEGSSPERHKDLLPEPAATHDDLSTERLLRTASAWDEEDLRRLFVTLDERMARDATETTQGLVRTGWWPYWRRQSKIADLSAAATAWLSCDAWSESETPEPTYESWVQVLEDVGRLSSDQVNGFLCDGRPLWPSIPPFEERQVAELAARCRDQETPVRQLSPEQETAERLVDAICRNDAESATWAELSATARGGWRGDAHPFFTLAAAIQRMQLGAEKRSLLERSAWPLVDTVTRNDRHSPFFRAAGKEEPLPLLELLRSLRRAGSSGDVAAGIALAPGNAANRSQPDWWKALLLGLAPRGGGFQRLEDDPVRAVRLVERCVENLPPQERMAWEKARRELSPDHPAFHHGDAS